MRVLSLGTDRKIFEEGSAARLRQQAYAAGLGDLYIIVFSKGGGLAAFSGEHMRAMPTRSWSRLLYGWDAWRIAKRLPKPDIVTVQDPFETGLIGLFIAKRLGVPLHVQVHTDFAARAFRRHSLLNRIRYHLAWYVVRRASRVRVILQRTKDELRQAGITVPIAVLPIFVDTDRFGALAREKHRRWKIDALFVGRLEHEKHPCLALDAVAFARAQGHDIGLTIVGEGTERAELEERARARGISDRVEFVGWQRDTAPFLAKADVALVPSRYEGYGLVIVEALAAGIPVIATDVGIAREAGAIVTDESHFAQTLLEWIADGPRQATLANYPYVAFDDYVTRWCADCAAAAALQ
jgi:glycosyltransferase involved in cell wall biosynthesis